MKLKWILPSLVILLILGTLSIAQWRKTSQQKAEIAQLQRSLEQNADKVRELEAAKEILNQQRRDLLDQTESRTAELQGQAGSTPSPANSIAAHTKPGEAEKGISAEAGFGKILSKMLEDPQTKSFLREQQRMVMDQLYGPLFKQIGLNPEEVNKFKDLLSDTAMQAAEKASSLFDNTGGTNRTEAFATLAADAKKQEDQLRELLGDGGYAQYKDYQMTIGERMQLNMFRQQMAGSEAALSDQQTEQLLAMMREEKANAQMSGDPVITSSQDPAELQAILTDDQSDKFIRTQEDVNARVYERAKAVLSPEQLNSFSTFQTNHLQMMRMGMGMARKMMGGDKPAVQP